jgi:hypothetical protein
VRLPEKAGVRREAYVELSRQCSTDRSERKSYHADLRTWYTTGTATGARARYNKGKAHIQQSSAYLYQSESVRFAAVLPPQYGEHFGKQLEAYRDEIHRWWHDSRAGLTVATGVRWHHVYPTVIFKVVPSAGEPHVTLVPDPADVGVLEPDRPFDRQEAKLHHYWLTIPKVRRLLSGHPNETELLKLAIESAETGSDDSIAGATTVERIMFDNVGAPLEGGGRPVAGNILPEPHVEAPRVPMAELWVVDDRLHDYRVVTMLAPGGEPTHTLLDRRNTVLAGIDPFVSLTLEDAPDYTWGFSALDDLTPLQEERDAYKEKILRLFDLQLDPPIVLFGFGGLKDDRAQRLRQPGGTLASPNPNGKAERLGPTMPPEAFGVLEGVDREFADAGGLPMLLQGQGEPGIRAGNQVGVMATLASARIRENAMRVEYACSEIATLAGLMMRELHDEPLTMDGGQRFLLSEVPRSVVFLVASHSASPLYAAAIGDKADRLLKAGAISRPSYTELLEPPMVDVLRIEARQLEKAAAERSERLLKIAELKASRGRSR